jgi:tetratricopeptide (TPR) repeat protein/transcriptional regulator with XRE-family HTH domain
MLAAIPHISRIGDAMAGEPAESFGATLRRLRYEAGLTQEELAEAASLSARSVSDLERGITLTARKETARLLADALDLTGPARATFEASARGRSAVRGFAEAGAVAATRTLPRDIAAFTGRDLELRQLMRAAAGPGSPGGLVTICGMPGVGKTALAVHAAHLLADLFPDRQLFIDLHAHTPGHEPISPDAALAGLLTAVGADGSYLPESLEGRAGLWRDRMAGQRAVLVLDNAACTEQVTPLLPGGESCLVLVTGRRHLADLPGVVVPLLLEAMPPGQAQAMFLRLAPRAGEPAAARELVRAAGNLPLAISLLARVYARHPSWTLDDLTRETNASLLTLVAEKDSVAAAFDLSYRHLTPGRQQFFRRLSLHPGATIDAYAAAALADVPLREADMHLDALHGECLLTEPGYRRYGMHDLIRRYAQDRALADDPADRERALCRMLDYYQHVAAVADTHLARQSRPKASLPVPGEPSFAVPDLPDHSGALSWVRTERGSLLACLEHATRTGKHARVVALTTAIAALLRQDGPLPGAAARHTAAAQAARHLGDRQGEARALSDLGDALYLSGDFREAAGAQEKALGIYRDLGDRQGQANALSDLGGLREVMGDRRGTADLDEALTICRELDDLLGEAWTLDWIGYARLLAGDLHGAAGPLTEALGLYRRLGYREGQAYALLHIGVVLRKVGDFRSAAESLAESLSIIHDVRHRPVQADVLTEIGVVHGCTGNYAGAAQTLAEALSICRDLGYRQGQATALTEIGVVRRETGDREGAASAFEEATSICRDLGYRAGEADALNEAGTLHRVCGDVSRAETCHRDALELAREISDSWDEARALAGLGRCALAAGHSTGAADGLRQAREILRRIGTADAASVGAELDALTGAGPRR